LTVWIVLVELAEDRDLVEGLRLVERMLPSWLVERDLGPREQAHRHVGVGRIAEAGRAGAAELFFPAEPRLPAPAFLAALQSLARNKEVALDGAWVRLPGHEVRLTDEEERLWGKARALIAGRERFRPPRVRDIGAMLNVPETEVRQTFKLLSRLGKVDEVAHDHFFLRNAVGEMVDIAADLAARAPNGQFTVAQFRDRLDNGRKVAIQILEFFDRHGITLRRGDLRRINKHRLDLFRRPSQEQAAPASMQAGGKLSPVGRPDFKSVSERISRS